MISEYYAYWIGAEKQLKKEIDCLKFLLALILEKEINVSFSENHVYKGYNWIGNIKNKFKKNENAGKILLYSSGTTGNPKFIQHDLNEIFYNKKGNGSPDDKWLLTYNPARWAGLSVILHCIKNKCELIIPEDLNINSILEAFPQATHVSLTPSLFKKMIISDTNHNLNKANIKQITFGGEYAYQSVLDLAKSIWPEAKISHVYASTETGDICSASDGFEGYPLSQLFKFHLSENGEAIINGKHTGDIWKIENDRIIFDGRSDDLINIGGNKISLFHVEKIISSIKEIKQCRTFSIDAPILGKVIGLEYIGDIDEKILKNKIKLLCLPKFAIPMQINKVEEIKLTSAGKISRK